MCDCAICLETTSEDNDLSITVCKHRFHTSCLLKWIRNNNLCPLCRTTLVEKEIVIEPEPLPSHERQNGGYDILDRMLDRSPGYTGDDAFWSAN